MPGQLFRFFNMNADALLWRRCQMGGWASTLQGTPSRTQNVELVQLRMPMYAF